MTCPAPILPPNLPPAIVRELALAYLGAPPGEDRDRAVREVVRLRADEIHRAWEKAVPLAMKSLREANVNYYANYYYPGRQRASLDLIFGTAPTIILDAIYQANSKRIKRILARDYRANNFDEAISRREGGRIRVRPGFLRAGARCSFDSAKRGGDW